MPLPGCIDVVVHAYVGGIGARSESYMRRHWDHAKAFVGAADLETEGRREEAAYVALQDEARLDLVSPAFTRWEDVFRPLCRDGSGVTTGTLTRYFETNTFYRQPHVTGDLVTPDADAWFGAFQIPKGRPWVLTLPSPWDFALRSRNDSRRSLAELTHHVGETLHVVVAAAFTRGAKLVRFHDPSIVYRRSATHDVDAFAEGLAAAARGHEKDCTLHLTNGDPFADVAVVEANPLSGLSIEDSGHKPRGFTLPNGTRLSAAVVQGEESLVESPQEIARRAHELADSLGVGLRAITNGWDLDHVPHAIAEKKIRALGQAKDVIAEVIA